MPCIPIKDGTVCVPNEPLSIVFQRRTYRFEWTAASGWCLVNADGSERLKDVPVGV